MVDHAVFHTLRLIHVVGGVYWAGAMFFVVLFLGPAVKAAGPDGGKVMQAVQARGFMNVTPLVALLVILSGIELMRRTSGNFQPEWFGTGAGIAYSTGMLAGIAALVIGLAVLRPTLIEAGRLAAQGGDMDRVGALRVRAAGASRIVAVLLLVATVAMALGRYV